MVDAHEQDWYTSSVLALLFALLLSTTACAEVPLQQGYVTAPIADLRSDQTLPQPGNSDDKQQTQLLRGEKVVILLSSGSWMYVQATEQPEYTTHQKWEGYPGWVLKSAIETQGLVPNPMAMARPQDVIPAAEKFLGTPYYWGGLSAQGIDCSGLTHLAYRWHNIVIPRDSHEQWMKATPIQPKDLKPGDLIFSAKPGKPVKVSHVTLYAGDGQILEAPQTGMVVRKISFVEKYGKPHTLLRNGSIVGGRALYFGSYPE